jgi:hypothetical protein
MRLLLSAEFENFVAVAPQRLSFMSLLAVPIKVQKIFSYNAPLNNLQFFEIKIFK